MNTARTQHEHSTNTAWTQHEHSMNTAGTQHEHSIQRGRSDDFSKRCFSNRAKVDRNRTCLYFLIMVSHVGECGARHMYVWALVYVSKSPDKSSPMILQAGHFLFMHHAWTSMTMNPTVRIGMHWRGAQSPLHRLVLPILLLSDYSSRNYCSLPQPHSTRRNHLHGIVIVLPSSQWWRWRGRRRRRRTLLSISTARWCRLWWRCRSIHTVAIATILDICRYHPHKWQQQQQHQQ